jgi:hypothetical protein
MFGVFLAAVGAVALMGAVWAFLNGTFPSDTADPHLVGYNVAALGLILIGVTLVRIGGKVWDSALHPAEDPVTS